MNMTAYNLAVELPGSVLSRSANFVIEADSVALVVKRLIEMRERGLRLLVTVGFDNFQSMVQHSQLKVERYVYDLTAGLEAQINGIFLYTELEKANVEIKFLSEEGIHTNDISEPYSPSLAAKYMAEGYIVLCNAAIDEGGLFDEDLASAVRSLEVSAGALCKAVPSVSLKHLGTSVSGSRLDVKLDDVIVGTAKLPLRGATAAFCRDHGLPIILFSIDSSASVSDLLVQGLPATDRVTILL
jgi:uridylate kinase